MNHKQEAEKHTESLKVLTGRDAAFDLDLAQVHATLALANQQRVANLISYFTQIDDTATALPVLHEIREALGLGDQK